jgi:hypothetical protein
MDEAFLQEIRKRLQVEVKHTQGDGVVVSQHVLVGGKTDCWDLE